MMLRCGDAANFNQTNSTKTQQEIGNQKKSMGYTEHDNYNTTLSKTPSMSD
jgi:hypothetical protein